MHILSGMKIVQIYDVIELILRKISGVLSFYGQIGSSFDLKRCDQTKNLMRFFWPQGCENNLNTLRPAQGGPYNFFRMCFTLHILE